MFEDTSSRSKQVTQEEQDRSLATKFTGTGIEDAISQFERKQLRYPTPAAKPVPKLSQWRVALVSSSASQAAVATSASSASRPEADGEEISEPSIAQLMATASSSFHKPAADSRAKNVASDIEKLLDNPEALHQYLQSLKP